MRPVLVLALALVLPATVAAQFPRNLRPLLRKLPSIDELLKGDPPLSTGFDDTMGRQPLLNAIQWGAPRPLADLERTASGGFVLEPGLWTGTFQSYCLTTAAYSPGQGNGYLFAPFKGSKAQVIQSVLRASAQHPDVQQGHIQLLLWGILARAKVSSLSPRLQATARALLTADQIHDLDDSALDLIPPSERARLFGRLPTAVRMVAEKDAEIRAELGRGVDDFERIERAAVLTGVAPEDASRAIERGEWARHPGGYWIRFFPSGFSSMRVELLVPGQATVTRDRLRRIIRIEDAHGGRTETTYDDAVAPRTVPDDPGLRAYAFQTIRLIRPDAAGGPPLVHEIHGKGWTFVRSKPPAAAAAGPVPLLSFTPRRSLDWFEPRAVQDTFSDWTERAQQAREMHERYEFYRDRAEAAGSRPSDDSVDELEDVEHYRDGVDAALGGDLGDQLEWLADHQERENAALSHATDVIDSLPTSSDDEVPVFDVTPREGDAPVWDPTGGMAVPSNRGQRLGISGR